MLYTTDSSHVATLHLTRVNSRNVFGQWKLFVYGLLSHVCNRLYTQNLMQAVCVRNEKESLLCRNPHVRTLEDVMYYIIYLICNYLLLPFLHAFLFLFPHRPAPAHGAFCFTNMDRSLWHTDHQILSAPTAMTIDGRGICHLTMNRYRLGAFD